MRNLKRALSLALASVMLLGMMVVGSSAASFPDVSNEDNTEAIAVLEAVKVMIGNEKGEFEPNKNVTRNEMAVIMAKLILGTYEADSYVGSHPFTDVPDWAQRYVAACYNAGIIAGRGEGIYDGQSTVTAVEAAAMMLRALGYEDLSLGAKQWDQPVAAKANEINLFDGLSGNSQTPMDRNTVAKLALNTLKATMVTTSRSGQDITLPDGTTIASVRNYNERGTSMYDYTQEDGQYADEDNKLQLCEYLYGRDLILTGGFDDLGRPTDLWQYKGDDVIETAKEAWKVMVINPDDAATISSVLTSDDYFDLSASSIDASVTYKRNGDTKADSESLQAGDVVELFRADNKVTKVIVTRYQLAKVSKVDDDVSSADAKDGAAYYVSLKGMNGTSLGTYNDNDFAGFNAAEYTEDTFVAIAQNGDSEIVASHVAKVVEGKVNAYKSPKTVTLGGAKYNLAASLAAGSVTSFDFDDTQYVIYMTENDYVLGIDGAEAVKLDDVYYVHSAYFTKTGNEQTSYYAQVVDMDGVESEIQIEETTFKDTFTGMDKINANKFNAVQKLYTFSDKDAVTAGGGATNYNGDTATVNAKSNNGKLSAKKYVTNDDYSVANGASNALDTLNGQIDSSSKSVTVTSGQFNAGGSTVKSAYIDSDTKFILIETNANPATNADLDIETYTGSARVASGVGAFVIASKDGTSYVADVVIVADTGISTGVSSDEVLYLTEASSTEVKDGYEATAYFMDGTSKTVTIDDDGGEGFYEFSVDKDGVYELGDPADSVSLSDNYDDETGVIDDTVISSIYNSRLITFVGAGGQNGYLKDIALSDNLQVVDARPSSVRNNSAYTQKITDLSRLEAAMDKGSVTATAYVDDGEVLLISVISMPDTRDADNTLGTANAEVTTGAGITAVSATIDAVNHKITVSVTGSPADGDKITVSGTANSAKATVTGSPVTLTYASASGAWTASGNITVTAENGSAQAYTVEGPLPKSADPTISIDLSSNPVYYAKGTATADVAALTITASGTDLTYQWQKKATGDTDFSDIDGATGNSYTPDVTETGTTEYKCLVYQTETDHAISDAKESTATPVSVIDVGVGTPDKDFSATQAETVTITFTVDNIADNTAVTLEWWDETYANKGSAPSNTTAAITNAKVENGAIVMTIIEDANSDIADGTYYYRLVIGTTNVHFDRSIKVGA